MARRVSALLILLLAYAPALASDKPAPIYVEALDPGFDPSAFTGYGTRLRRPPESRTRPPLRPAARDRALARAGLVDKVASWDQLEKDLLVMRASVFPIAELARKYDGKLDREALIRLKTALAEGAR